jgi:hypothetical protein
MQSYSCVFNIYAPLEWKKIVGILKDLNLVGFFHAVAFVIHDFFLLNPSKFLCDYLLHRNFGGKNMSSNLLETFL